MLAQARAIEFSKKLPIGCTMSELRHLDLDDLIGMVMISEGVRQVEIAKALGLTPPAVSHRVRKWESVFGIRMLERNRDGQHCLVLTEDGSRVVNRSRHVLEALTS